MGKPVPGSDLIDKKVQNVMKDILITFFGGTAAIVRTKVFMNLPEKELRDLSLMSGIIKQYADNYLSIRVEQKLGGHIGATLKPGDVKNVKEIFSVKPKQKLKPKQKPKQKLKTSKIVVKAAPKIEVAQEIAT